MGRAAALLVAAALLAGCASLEPAHDWWAVRATGRGEAARLSSTSHVNHGRPARTGPLAPRLLREAHRGAVTVAVQYDTALDPAWAGAGWTFGRELDKAVEWASRITGTAGANVSVTLVDAAHAIDVEHDHPARPPTVALYVAVEDAPASHSAAVGSALSKALHELVHATSALEGRAPDRRFAEERRAALVEACYLLDTRRPGDAFAFEVGAGHAATDNFATLQSRAAAIAVVQELRRIAGSARLADDDSAARAALDARCDQAGGSGR